MVDVLRRASPASATASSAAAREVLQLLWNSPFPASLQDASFCFIDVNPAFADFIGMPLEALIGRDFIEFLPEEDRQATIENRKRFVAAGSRVETAYGTEGRLLDAGGFERWYRAARHVL
ncbi:MAG: PAS domain S-box protein, partial [Pseudomonadota bacterium]|nr:PAS domain S-box protein [Pseudomonadota bacterium]